MAEIGKLEDSAVSTRIGGQDICSGQSCSDRNGSTQRLPLTLSIFGLDTDCCFDVGVDTTK